ETAAPSKLMIHADPEIADLIPKFLDNRMKDIEALREALERGDFETIRTLGHMMKGAGGGYGFLGITEIGKMLEESARAGNAQDISRGIEALSAYMNSVEVVYDEP
ncbi:MAG TPA: Hpt domain-containing protein, partial [Acidobacteriota bacterium]|nr:Hpt domain-containing protein [Acidobacteriota bacterium]